MDTRYLHANPKSAIPNPQLRASVLIVDDDQECRTFAAAALQDQGYKVTAYDPGASRAGILDNAYDVAILDIVMPNKDGFEMRGEILKHSSGTQFIFMTGDPDREKLNRAMDLGVFTFLTKPFTPMQIRYAVYGALRMKQLLQKNLEYDALVQSQSMGLVGDSPVIRKIRQQILELAPLNVPVLVTGESGTGKEVIARCIHQYSRRSSKEFVAVNCAGFSSTLIESELFGHAQGAFTGATKTKHGFFEVADGGTLFLDEIGDMPLELQTRLLRVLDKGEFTRVGDTKGRHVDVRVISATNRHLKELVEKNQFRKDLYFRLRGRGIAITPLRERKEDIPALAHHFFKDERFVVTPQAMEILQAFEWQGNVRELRMVITNLKGVCANKIITKEAAEWILFGQGTGEITEATTMTYRKFKEEFLKNSEKSYFGSLLKSAKGNVSKAAEIAGIHRVNLHNKLKQLGIGKENL